VLSHEPCLGLVRDTPDANALLPNTNPLLHEEVGILSVISFVQSNSVIDVGRDVMAADEWKLST
jgi:hypothetical protein